LNSVIICPLVKSQSLNILQQKIMCFNCNNRMQLTQLQDSLLKLTKFIVKVFDTVVELLLGIMVCILGQLIRSDKHML